MGTHDELDAKALYLVKLVVEMTTAAGSGHPSSAAGLAHIVTALMYRHMRYDPADPWNLEADRLVLSEGHAVPIIYAAYADLGGVVGPTPEEARKLTLADLNTLRQVSSPLDGHPNPSAGFPFFDAATGSLGQGLSVASGLALAARMDGSARRVFCIAGDGECREGQIWEAVDFAVDCRFDNLRLFVSANRMGQSDYVSAQQSAERLNAKFLAAGWASRIIDGHNTGQVLDFLSAHATGPMAAVAETTKGWGVSELARVGYHGKPLSEEGRDKAIAELEGLRKRSGLPDGREVELQPPAPASTRYRPDVGLVSLGVPDFDRMLDGDSFLKKWQTGGKISTRRVYGLALREAGREARDLVVLDGDVSNSTFTAYFKDAYPERFVECRIAEQNMISVAVGLAAAGKRPVANSFGKFLVRGYDQVELALVGGCPLKLVGSHTGASLGADGPSQMALVDMAFFRATPNVLLLVPADGYSAFRLTEVFLNHDGPAYMRTLRSDLPLIYNADETFEPGGSNRVAEGGDVYLVSAGYMLHECLKARELLAAKGVKAAVIDAYTLPIVAGVLPEIMADPTNRVMVVEDNFAGGIGSAAAEYSAECQGACVRTITLRRYPKSGRSADEVFAWLGLSAEDIARQAAAFAESA